MARLPARSYDYRVRRLAAWAAGLPPPAQDLALALALAAYNIGAMIPETGQLRLPGVTFPTAVLQTLPLTWRRRWPVGVLLAVSLFRTVEDNIGGFEPLYLASLIAYYTVMDRSSTRVRVVISVVMLAGIITELSLPGHNMSSEFPIVALEFVTAGMAGIISRTRRAYLQEAQARAERAEAVRDREVALAAAQERARIGRELHDVVAHHVSLIAVQSDAAATLLPGQPVQAVKHVEVIGQTAREAMGELRRLLGVLRTPASAWPPAAGHLTAPVGQPPRHGARPGPRGGDQGGPAGGRQHGQAGTRRGPGRLPHRPGGTDQHRPAFRGGQGSGDTPL